MERGSWRKGEKMLNCKLVYYCEEQKSFFIFSCWTLLGSGISCSNFEIVWMLRQIALLTISWLLCSGSFASLSAINLERLQVSPSVFLPLSVSMVNYSTVKVTNANRFRCHFQYCSVAGGWSEFVILLKRETKKWSDGVPFDRRQNHWGNHLASCIQFSMKHIQFWIQGVFVFRIKSPTLHEYRARRIINVGHRMLI